MDRDSIPSVSGPSIVVPLSKHKIVLVLLGSIAFVAIAIWMWSYAESQRRYPPLYVRSAAVACGLFFGACSVYAFFKLLDSKPGLIVDLNGIVDNSSGVAAGRVPWDEIVAVKSSEIMGGRFLTIVVSNPQKYVGRGNFLLRMSNAANMKLTGSPINISSTALALKFDDLEEIIRLSAERCASGRRSKR
jgi:hypothetical protein